MSLPRYAKYKDSGVEWLGQCPAHWSLKRLRFIAELNPSKSEVAGLDREAEVSFLPMEAIGDDGSLRLDKTRPIREVETGYTYFRDGDVTLAKITPCFENGKGALMKDLQGGIGFGTTELIVARPKADQSSGDFLNWIFRSPNFRQQGEASMYGAGGQKRVPDNFVRDLVWAFPSIREQATIAAFLDYETGKIDVLIAEQEKLIALLAEKRQATISHAVTRGLNPATPTKASGVAWMGEVPTHWVVCTVRRVLARIEQGWSPECFNRPAEYSEWAVLKTGCVNGGTFNANENKALPESLVPDPSIEVRDGDLLMSRANGSPALVGAIAYISNPPPRLMLSDKIFRLHLRQWMSPRFFAMAFGARYLRHQIEQALSGAEGLANNLPQSALKSFTIAVPPLAQQQQLVAFVDIETTKLDLLRSEAKRAIALLKERRSALIAAAVTGQIDVRGAVARPDATMEAMAA